MNRATSSVHAIGDSVMQAAGTTLYGTLPAALPGITVDAAPNRQFRHAIDLVRELLAAGRPPEVLVVHLGTNGPLAATTFDRLVEATRDVDRVIVLNVWAPRAWVPEVNAQLAAGVDRHASVVELVDWAAVAGTEPDLLHRDGFHMNRRGASRYAELIRATVELR